MKLLSRPLRSGRRLVAQGRDLGPAESTYPTLVYTFALYLRGVFPDPLNRCA